MQNRRPRIDLPAPPAPHAQGEACGRVVTGRVATLDPAPAAYSCLACGSDWDYQAVRNTGRCPSCGGGLRRVPDWP